MAEYVDELRLGIQVEDNKSGEKVKSLASAISSLNRAISKVDTAKLAETFKTLKTEIGGFADELKSAEKSLTAMAEIIKKTGTITKAKEQVKTAEVEEKTSAESDDIATPEVTTGEVAQPRSLDESSLTSTLDIVELQKKELARLYDESRKIGLSDKERLRIAQQIAALEKKINGNNKKALLQDTLRVAKYRILRTILKELSKGISDAFSAAASQSPQMQQLLSSATSSLRIIQSSLGGIIVNLLPIIEPILKGVAQVLGTIANVISRTIARLTNQSQYLKINTDYWKEYNEQVQGTLLSFDTFNTLNAKSDVELFKTEDVQKNVEGFDTISSLVQSILLVFTALGLTKFVSWIIGGGLKTVLKTIKQIFPVLKNIDAIKFFSLLALIAGVTILIEGIKKLKQEWNNVNFDSWEKAATIISGIAAGILGIYVGLKAIHLPLAAALGLGAALAGGIIMLQTHLATAYADGGMFEGAGTMYAIAGENGAEVVAQGSAGTGVLNVSQFKQAMVEALYEYGAARGQLDGISVNMDGNAVGRAVAASGGFKNEAIRRGNSWR